MKKTILSLLCLTLAILLLAGCEITITPAGDTNAPNTQAPDSDAPDSKIPDSSAPDDTSKAPDTTEPPADTQPPKPLEYDESIVILADTFKYPVENEYEGVWKDENGNPQYNQFLIPALNLSTANAKAFNAKLLEVSAEYRTDCENEPKSGRIYFFDYEVAERDNVVAIRINETFSAMSAGVGRAYDAYYYDINADRELSLAEYLGRFGFTEKTLTEKLVASREYLTLGWDGDPTPASVLLDPANEGIGISTVQFHEGTDVTVYLTPSYDWFWPVEVTFGIF